MRARAVRIFPNSNPHPTVMADNPDQLIKETRQRMQKAVDHTLSDFHSLHTGKASTSMVDSLPVEAYGGTMKMKEVAAVTTPDMRTVAIQPWDKSLLKPVEKAVQTANLGLNPTIMGDIVRCPVPELSRERRQELVKLASGMAEDGKVGVRAARREAMDQLKAMEKDKTISEDDGRRYEKEVQKLTDERVKAIDEQLANKEKELMKI